MDNYGAMRRYIADDGLNTCEATMVALLEKTVYMCDL